VSGDGARCDWQVAPQNRQATTVLAEALSVPRIIAHLLITRGVRSPEEGRRFLEPSVDHLSDPFELDGMQCAIDRIRRAREQGEHVLVFGDYDVDGITGTTILVNALRRFGVERLSYAMPDRLEDGYGLSPHQVKAAHEDGVALIITADNGTTAHDAAEAAREHGIDLVVTDHHSLGETLPEAVAVLNPKRQDPDYPGAEACGAGVAFKLAWALTGEMADLDLVAMGTVADIVPLRGENRDLVAAGLQDAGERGRLGLAKLAKVARVDLSRLRADQIAFQLAPRINAASRVGEGITGLRLLLSDSESDAQGMAETLNSANEERRALEQTIYDEALEILARTFRDEQRSIVLAGSNWHAGVIGIVASRIQGVYYRPVVLMAIDGAGVVRGSARSVRGFDIGAALAACEAHLITHGGHKAAAGLTIAEENIPAFQQAFETVAAQHLPEGPLRKPLDIDAQIALSSVDSRLVRLLDQLRPFGQGNPSPVFCTYGVTLMPNSLRELRGGHLRMALKEGPSLLQAIGFRMEDRLPDLSCATTLDVAYTPQFNTYRGETTVQLVLKDLRAAG
jgi:single-stranded-DNA-specific exonuclease